MTPHALDPQTRVRVPLPSDATAPMIARHALDNLLRGWRLTAMTDEISLATSELVTNAFRHGAPPIRLTVRRSRSRVSVGVADSSPARPKRVDAALYSEGGRGMSIVDQVASDSGSRPDEPGKVVWAGFDIDPAE